MRKLAVTGVTSGVGLRLAEIARERRLGGDEARAMAARARAEGAR